MSNRFENNKSIAYIEQNGVNLIKFKNLLKYESVISHCFTTRLGGVSSGECSSLNLGFNRKDDRENVMENYTRVADAIDVKLENMVLSNQVHDNKVRIVDETDRGKGIIRSSDIIGFDGLMTNKKEVVLVTFYADCVPLLFFDPVENVIASAHSGWRSTVKQIGPEVISKMVNDFGCKSENIEVGIGPSIGSCCFEVGEEVVEEFVKSFPWCEKYCKKTGDRKYHLDLQSIIRTNLTCSGINEEKICTAGICTKCNKDVFFSHRGDEGKTGSMCAMIQIRNS